jgi:hypothetical protein
LLHADAQREKTVAAAKPAALVLREAEPVVENVELMLRDSIAFDGGNKIEVALGVHVVVCYRSVTPPRLPMLPIGNIIVKEG